MKKYLLTFCLSTMLSVLVVKGQPVITNLNFASQHSDVSVADMNGDGYMDVLITGEDAGNKVLQMFFNNGSGVLTPVASPFTAVIRSSIDWNDINNDGKPDVLISGFPTVGDAYSRIFTSDGAGTFTESSISTIQLAPSSGMADLNNDGYTDIFIFGNRWQGKPKIYFNDRVGGFTETSPFDGYDFIDTDVTIVDFDNDADLDLFVNAASDDVVSSRFTKIFVNTNGSFAPMNLTAVIPKGYGSAVWGDYDGDGYLDLLLNGDGWYGTSENSNEIVRLYHNDAGSGTFTPAATFNDYRQGSTGDACRFADWDNDGDLDVIISGWNNGAGKQATAIFLNNAGTFTPYPFNDNLPGVSENSIEVADIDNDGDLDLIVNGFSGNDYNGAGSRYDKNVSILITNPATIINTKPTPPSNLRVSGSQAGVTLNWDAASDATTPQKGLSYNLFIIDQTGKWFYYPMADTITGNLKLQRLGNVQLNKSWTIKNLPAGTYRWGVQAVDNSFAASLFAKSTFTIDASGTLPVVLRSFTATAAGTKSLIQWSTASEINNDHFLIEKSTDGRIYNFMATVKADNNSSGNYLVADNSPNEGLNYYKLIQFDKDGHSIVYGVKTVNFKTGITRAVVYPNPVMNNSFGVRLTNYSGSTIHLSLIDVTGRQVYQKVVATSGTQNYYTIQPAGKLPEGQYVLQIRGKGYNENIIVNMLK